MKEIVLEIIKGPCKLSLLYLDEQHGAGGYETCREAKALRFPNSPQTTRKPPQKDGLNYA